MSFANSNQYLLVHKFLQLTEMKFKGIQRKKLPHTKVFRQKISYGLRITYELIRDH